MPSAAEMAVLLLSEFVCVEIITHWPSVGEQHQMNVTKTAYNGNYSTCIKMLCIEALLF